MKRGTDPETGKSYGLLAKDERKAIARAKTIIESWWWANREWRDKNDPEDPPSIAEEASHALAALLEVDNGEPPTPYVVQPEATEPTLPDTPAGNPMEQGANSADAKRAAETARHHGIKR